MIKYLCSVLIIMSLSGCKEPDTNKDTKELDNLVISSHRNITVYEFTPKTSPYIQCVYIDGWNGGGLHCFDKK